MNLYNVMDKNYEWSCFVFAPTRNKAKYMVSNHLFQDYIDLRCRLLKRGVNVPFPLIVDCPEDAGYDLVLKCGYKYVIEESFNDYMFY